jgi:hypothetical protein
MQNLRALSLDGVDAEKLSLLLGGLGEDARRTLHTIKLTFNTPAAADPHLPLALAPFAALKYVAVLVVYPR